MTVKAQKEPLTRLNAGAPTTALGCVELSVGLVAFITRFSRQTGNTLSMSALRLLRSLCCCSFCLQSQRNARLRRDHRTFAKCATCNILSANYRGFGNSSEKYVGLSARIKCMHAVAYVMMENKARIQRCSGQRSSRSEITHG